MIRSPSCQRPKPGRQEPPAHSGWAVRLTEIRGLLIMEDKFMGFFMFAVSSGSKSRASLCGGADWWHVACARCRYCLNFGRGCCVALEHRFSANNKAVLYIIVLHFACSPNKMY